MDLTSRLQLWISIALIAALTRLGHLPGVDGGALFGEGGLKLKAPEMQGFPQSKQFIEEYVWKYEPLVMRNAASNFPAFKLWDDEYFLKLDISDDASLVTVETQKKENRSQETLNIPFKEFVELYNKTEYYMVNPTPPFLGKDVILPGPLQCRQMYEGNLVENVMWFSSGGTKSVVHTDAVDNILCLIRGEKKFVMVDPAKYGERVPIDHPEGAYSDINVDSVDFEQYPGLRGIEYYHIYVNAGDCLYIPYKWIHQVRSFERNLAVNIWWNHHQTYDIDTEQCPDEFDNDLTLDKVVFTSFSELMNTPSALRDQFHDFSSRIENLRLAKFIKLLTVGMSPELDHVGDNVAQPLKHIFKTIDVNRDGIMSPNEVLAVTDDDWSSIQRLMNDFDALLDYIEERMAEEEDEEEDEDEDEEAPTRNYDEL